MVLGKHRVRDALRVAVCIRDQLQCRYCGADVDSSAHIDHVVPRAHGGSREATNLVLACPTCNERKSNQPVEKFHGHIEPGVLTRETLEVAHEIHLKAKRKARVRTALIRAHLEGR